MMIRDDLYYFDALPDHPAPEPGEAATGYLSRLFDLNDTDVPSDLTVPMPPKGWPIHVSRMRDMPPLSSRILEDLTVCSEERLRTTTFHHVVRKFLGPTTSSRSVKGFLRSSIAFTLRYCPHCLSDHRYYRLIWRFTAVTGCVEYKRLLMDRCGQCGKTLPLFAAHVPSGICPACRADLARWDGAAMAPDEQTALADRVADIEFLVTPHACEEGSGDTLRAIGAHFRHLREANHLLPHEVYARLPITPLKSTQAIERGTLQGSLNTYIVYATFYGVTLRHLFTAPPAEDVVPEATRRRRDRERATLHRIQRALEDLTLPPILYSKTEAAEAVAAHLGISTGFLSCPGVADLFASYYRDHKVVP